MVENIVRKGEFACYNNFSFCHNVFHSYISLVRQNAVLCGTNRIKKGHGSLKINQKQISPPS